MIFALCSLLQCLLYGLQTYDAFNTVHHVKAGYVEQTPWLKPFSHSVISMGIALWGEDRAFDLAASHWSDGRRNALYLLQIDNSFTSIKRTNGWHIGVEIKF
jgi:hypothetical protein